MISEQFINTPFIVLADGSIYFITQDATTKGDTCSYTHHDCVHDADGNCKKDENGNYTPTQWEAYDCGSIKFDVNGMKKPNRYGQDVYYLIVKNNELPITDWAPAHTKEHINNILTNKY